MDVDVILLGKKLHDCRNFRRVYLPYIHLNIRKTLYFLPRRVPEILPLHR